MIHSANNLAVWLWAWLLWNVTTNIRQVALFQSLWPHVLHLTKLIRSYRDIDSMESLPDCFQAGNSVNYRWIRSSLASNRRNKPKKEEEGWLRMLIWLPRGKSCSWSEVEAQSRRLQTQGSQNLDEIEQVRTSKETWRFWIDY